MSFRPARLLTALLIGTCVSTVAFAAASAASSQTLIWRGDVTTARGVVNDVAKAWEKSGHGKIELQPFNTASGLDAVTSGKADLAGSARAGTGSEGSLTFTPVAWDALVMVTHASNPVSNLTLAQLHDIYYGKITNWKEVGGSDQPIDLYAVASPGDGVEFSLRKLLFGRGNQPVAAPRLYVNTVKLEEGVGIDVAGLGATTMAGIRGNAKVKILHIDGIAPSTASVSDGSYPLYTPLYLVTNATSPKAADAQAFVDFVNGDKGKAILRQHQLVPYQDGIALASMDAGRRSKILAETGGHASSEPLATASAAGATLATSSGAQHVPATSGVLAAIEAGNSKKAKKEAIAAAAAEPSLAGVTGSATTSTAAEEAPSLAHVVGDAITVAAGSSRGSDFSRVTGDAVVVRSKPVRSKPVHTKPAKQAPAKKVAEEKPQAKPAKAAKTEKVAKAKVMKTYTVGAGETLYSIARKHSVDEAQVRAWNHLKGDKVKLGQTLIIGAR